MNCRTCGATLSQGSPSCPQCGAPVEPKGYAQGSTTPYAPPTSAAHVPVPQQETYVPVPQPAASAQQPVSSYAPAPASQQPIYPASPAPAYQQPAYAPAPAPQRPAYAAPTPASRQPAYAAPPLAPQRPAPSYGAPVYMAPAPAPAAVPGPALAENTLRVIVLAAAFFATIVISTFFVAGWDENSVGYLDVIYLAMLGCGAYLVAKPGILPKATAGAIAVLAPLSYSAAFTIFLRFKEVLLLDPFALFQNANIMILPRNLVWSILVIAAAFGLSFLFKQQMKHRTGIMAACVGGASVLLSFLFGAIIGFGNIPAVFMTQFLGQLPAGLVIGLVYVLASMLATMQSYDLETKIGHKVWFGLCLGFTTLSFLITFIGSYVGSMFFGYSGFVLAVLTIVGIVGYVQLLMSKRIGLFLVLIATGTMFFGIFLPSFTQLMGVVGYGTGPAGLYLEKLGSSFSTLLNPFITSLVVFFIWKKIPAAKPYAKPAVQAAFKVVAIAGIVIGFVLFLMGSAQFFNPYAVRSGTTLPAVSFLCGVFLGAGTTVTSIYATLAAFRNQSKAPFALFITECVLAFFALASIAILLINS